MPSTSKSKKPEAKEAKKEPVVEMRPYFEEKDRKFVLYLFYSTYLNLVPRGVKLRVIAGPPVIPLVWTALFGALVYLCVQVINPIGWPMMGLATFYAILTLVAISGPLFVLLWYVDKFDVSNRVLEGLDNDLDDIEAFYRGWEKSPQQEEQQQQRTRDESVKGQFWVLTVDGNVVGCIGADQHAKDVVKKFTHSKSNQPMRVADLPQLRHSTEVTQASWPRIAYGLACIDDFVRWVLVSCSEKLRRLVGLDAETDVTEILCRAQEPNEGTVRRLAIKTEFQNHGLSTPLLKRVAFWAHSQNIEYLFAETDELQIKMAQILEKQHGYQLVSTQKVGWYGSKSLWRLDVKLWMQQEVERKNKQEELDKQRNEDEELKEYD
ncbi:hypothetical protein DM01DRAFT_1409062 [Hesseltinella vesiculosa]|uniref:N-acetyltransferase domain-containing protein n=1 Tax=Hesseltinella vesiculosa TaxID=101127 RepID=A0A1X2GCG3_9FUNG|nr:hypothetical protein DM01DRAFT_1409062 [Hesseltinella vesiculosa]